MLVLALLVQARVGSTFAYIPLLYMCVDVYVGVYVGVCGNVCVCVYVCVIIEINIGRR